MRTSACKRIFILLSICFALFTTKVAAQTGTTSLRGSILDKSGASVAGAAITLTDNELSVQRSTVSNSTGAYEFASLPPGTYSLRVEAPGFRAYDQKNIQLLVNNPATVNVTLLIGTTHEK